MTSLSAEAPSLLVCINRSALITPTLFLHARSSAHVLAAAQPQVGKAVGGQSLMYADVSYHAVG